MQCKTVICLNGSVLCIPNAFDEMLTLCSSTASASPSALCMPVVPVQRAFSRYPFYLLSRSFIARTRLLIPVQSACFLTLTPVSLSLYMSAEDEKVRSRSARGRKLLLYLLTGSEGFRVHVTDLICHAGDP